MSIPDAVDSTSQAFKVLQEAYLQQVNPKPRWFNIQEPKISQAWHRALEQAQEDPEDQERQRIEKNLKEWDEWLEEKWGGGKRQDGPRRALAASRSDDLHRGDTQVALK